MAELMNLFVADLTIGDVINIFLLVLTVVGLGFTVIQLIQTKKINRAELVKELYLMLYDDQQMRDFFYEIDWSSFTEGELGVENRDFENKADKLLSFFEVLCSMYYRHIITKTDMTLFEYELKRVYDHPDVQVYFDYLKGWQEKQKIGESYVNYKRYCSEHR